MTKEYSYLSSNTINKLIKLRDKSDVYMILSGKDISTSQQAYLALSNKKEIKGKETIYSVDKQELVSIINELKEKLHN